jgi:hypothetical protein
MTRGRPPHNRLALINPGRHLDVKSDGRRRGGARRSRLLAIISKRDTVIFWRMSVEVFSRPCRPRPLMAPSRRSTMSTYWSPMWGKADPKQTDIDCMGAADEAGRSGEAYFGDLNPGISPDLYLLRLRSSRRDKCWDQDHI